MDHAGFQGWLDRYIEAWRSNDPEAIAALFTEDARYSYHPYDEDIVDRAEIVKSWLDEPDEPGSWEAHYEPWAIQGDRGVALGWSRYVKDPDQRSEYANAYLVTFAEDGRAREFREFYMETRDGARKRHQQAIDEAVEKARAEWQQHGSQATAEPSATRVQG